MFAWPVRVYIEDTFRRRRHCFMPTTCASWSGSAREYIRNLGFPRIEAVDDSVMFVVHSLNIRYLRQPVWMMN